MQSTAVNGTRLQFKGLRHSTRLPCRLHVCAASSEPAQLVVAQQQQDAVKHVLRAVAIAAAVYAGASAAPAYAWDHGWKPRRHHRRMTDSKSGRLDIQAMLQVDLQCKFLQ